MYYIAHRGYTRHGTCSDNSLESFQNAIDDGFDMIEMDIQLTKDNVIVIYHDIHIDGTPIREMTEKTLTNSHPEMLTLQEFFNIFGNHVKNGLIQIYLDLKGCEYLSVKLIELFIKQDICLENICIGSFNINHLTLLRDLSIDFKVPPKLGYITSSKYPLSFYNELFNYIDFLSVDINIIDKQIFNTTKKNNKKLFVYTCSNEKDKLYLKRMKIDGIVSNILLT